MRPLTGPLADSEIPNELTRQLPNEGVTDTSGIAGKPLSIAPTDALANRLELVGSSVEIRKHLERVVKDDLRDGTKKRLAYLNNCSHGELRSPI